MRAFKGNVESADSKSVIAIELAPEPAAPTIAYLRASPTSITVGKSATLTWSGITNTDTIEIDQGIGKVSASGSKSVTPRTTTTYTLTAKCGSNTVTRTAAVGVILTIPVK